AEHGWPMRGGRATAARSRSTAPGATPMKQRPVSRASAAKQSPARRLTVIVLGTLAVLGALTISDRAALAATQLPVPGPPTTTQVTPTSITFTWTAPAGPVNNYTIQVAANQDPYHDVATTTGTTYTDAGLTPDTVYHHRVIANPTPGSGYTASDPS